jgi:hypothetical protein
VACASSRVHRRLAHQQRTGGLDHGTLLRRVHRVRPVPRHAHRPVDPRSVYLTGVGLTVASHVGFAGFADGPWSAAAARVLAGMGWAGTYMTGLKLLADRVEPALMSRAVAGHAASIGIAGAVSFLVRGPLEPLARMARGVRRGRRRDRDRLADHRPVGARSDAPLRPRAAPTRHPPARSSTSDPCCGTAPPWPTPSRTAPTPGK